MGNSNHITVYDVDYEQWLRNQHLPCPPARPTNRYPTIGDLHWAVAQFPLLITELRQPYLSIFDTHNNPILTIDSTHWEDPTATPLYIALRGFREWEIRIVKTLCQRCGQLVIYPDSGSSAIILDDTHDVDAYITVWEQSEHHPDDWHYVHTTLYT